MNLAFEKPIVGTLIGTALCVLSACGGGSTANVQNPTSPLPPTVSIALQSPSSQSILINATAELTAVVTNDSNNEGVDWTITCSSANCGKLSSLHTSSGDTTTYTPPPSLAGNSQSVSIVAFATADHTQNTTASIMVTGFATGLRGNYVLQAHGVDATLNPYQFAGVIVLDGNGNITGGEQTVNFYDENEDVNTVVSRADPVSGGSYFLGADGRGTLTIQTADAEVGQNGTESFSFVLLSSAHALIAQMDTFESGTGTMDLQTAATTAPTGGYAFVVSGLDIPSYSPEAFGGILNIDSPGTISGAGSLVDQNLYGYMTSNQKVSGTVSAPDQFGAVTFSLSAPSLTSATTFQFTGYMVDGTRIVLAESDNDSGAGSGSAGGLAIAQGSATGTFHDASAFSGDFVFGVVGMDLTGFTPDTLTSVGVLTADGAGNVSSGFTDTLFQQNYNQPPNYTGAQISSSFIGAYTLDKAGAGRVRVALKGFTPPVHPSITQSFIFYLTGNGNPPLVLDSGDGTGNYPSVGSGIAYPRSTQLSLSGGYGFSIVQENGNENDGTGQFAADASTKTVSGSFDMNYGFTAAFNNAFSNTFQAPDSQGRVVGTLFNSANPVVYYPIDPAHGFVVETDLVNPGSGQVSFGYYGTRTPVCDGCP